MPAHLQWMPICFLMVSFAISLLFLWHRNIYDDEYTSLRYVHLPISEVIRVANSGDVHPPGMYLLARISYAVVPSARWMTLFVQLAMYSGLSVFVCRLTPLFRSVQTRVCFLVLTTLNPQLLLWGNSIRWYGWWTPLALVTLVYALQPTLGERCPEFTVRRGVGLGLLLAALFYLNYVTLIFGAALGLALVLGCSVRFWKSYCACLGVFVVLIAPQAPAFITVHLRRGGEQVSNPVVSLAHLAFGSLVSEAYVPWHPLALLSLGLFLGLSGIAVFQGIHLARKPTAESSWLLQHRGLLRIAFFALIFFTLIALSGLGLKARNALLLEPTLALVLSLALGSIRWRGLQTGVLVGLFIWAGGGIVHLVTRQGLAKSGVDSHPEDVLALMRQTASQETPAPCQLLVTTNALLTYTAKMSDLSRLQVLSLGQNGVYGDGRTYQPADCRILQVFWVDSYPGGLGRAGQMAEAEMREVEAALGTEAVTYRLDYDESAAQRRSFRFLRDDPPHPDYRYVVTITRVSISDMPRIVKALSHFVPADGVTPRVPRR